MIETMFPTIYPIDNGSFIFERVALRNGVTNYHDKDWRSAVYSVELRGKILMLRERRKQVKVMPTLLMKQVYPRCEVS